MKDLLTEDQAWALLRGHIDDIRTCLVAGWNAWRDLGSRVPDHVVRFDSTTRAGIINNEIVAEARRRFHNVPGVNVTAQGRMVVLVFGGILILRFKKIDRNFRTRNVPTRQAQRFQYQMEMEGLPPEATVVVAGYLLTALQDAVHGNWLVCSYGTGLEWKIPLDSLTSSSPALLQTAPDPARPPVRSAKIQPIEKEETGG